MSASNNLKIRFKVKFDDNRLKELIPSGPGDPKNNFHGVKFVSGLKPFGPGSPCGA